MGRKSRGFIHFYVLFLFSDGSIQPITCLLCNQPLENVVQIRIHLISQLHRDREQQIHFKPSRK